LYAQRDIILPTHFHEDPEKSGLVKERSNGKYSLGYQYFRVAHNAMLSYLKTWRKQSRYLLFGEMGERDNRSLLEMVK
jgi:hypothetical protein